MGGTIAFDGTNLYIGNFDGSEILVTDRSGTPIRTFLTGLRPAGMAFDPATDHLWVISQFDMTISEITTQGVLIRECDGPRNPGIQGLGAVTMVGSKLYIAEVSDPDPFTPPDIPGTIFIVDPRNLTCNPPLLLTVAIDIKPGSDPNSINLRSRGKIPVSILSGPTFDAPASVDTTSLTFGRTGDKTSLAFCNGSPGDVNGDGFLDLICHFDTQETGFQSGDTEGVLKGETFTGTPIIGTDSVRIVPR